MPILFANEDQAYLDWISKHPDGFVLNISKFGQNDTNIRLHKTPCVRIGAKGKLQSENARTNTYMKVWCMTKPPLVAWAHRSKRLTKPFHEYECSHCNP